MNQKNAKSHNLSNNIKWLLNEESIDALSLSKLLTQKSYKVSQSTLSQIINGKENTTLSTLLAIAHFFNISVSELIGEVPIRENRKSANISKTFKSILKVSAVPGPKSSFTKVQVKIMQGYARQGMTLTSLFCSSCGKKINRAMNRKS